MASGAMWCVMIVVATVALGGCGGSRESAAAAACEAAAKERSQGKLLAVDLEALAASAVPEGEDVLRLQAPVTFDTGLQSQYSQTLDCRVKITAEGPKVIRTTFVF